jgi:hypothetical protein
MTRDPDRAEMLALLAALPFAHEADEFDHEEACEKDRRSNFGRVSDRL